MSCKDPKVVRDLLNDDYFYKWIIEPDQECSNFWTRWANGNAQRNACIQTAKTILLSIEFKTDSISQTNKDVLWDSITDQIQKSSPTADTSSIDNSHQKKVKGHLWYGIAAAVTFLMIVLFSYYSDWDKPAEVAKSEIVTIKKVAEKGKISSFRFEDGTIVKLFAGSTIRFPEHFSGESREVYLEGEGFFEVKADPGRPFIVKTNSLLTTALGTSFNVRTYENSGKCDVSLVTGKVKVENLESSTGTLNQVILMPGEEAVLENGTVLKQPFNEEEKVSWKDGYIYLEDKTFSETLEILERWFAVDFEVINQELAEGTKGSGKIQAHNLEHTLQVIGSSFGFSYQVNEGKVIITL
ncbi:MAG: anti-sigma factor [Cyclobacteriaceae bacterium]|nr:MAG: anti-sigma factor [Cyclobacteriaceae bacterium]